MSRRPLPDVELRRARRSSMGGGAGSDWRQIGSIDWSRPSSVRGSGLRYRPFLPFFRFMVVLVGGGLCLMVLGCGLGRWLGRDRRSGVGEKGAVLWCWSRAAKFFLAGLSTAAKSFPAREARLHSRVCPCDDCELAPTAAAICSAYDRDVHSASTLTGHYDRVPVEPFHGGSVEIIRGGASLKFHRDRQYFLAGSLT
ncbi:Zinc finger protein CONSTANS-LIKE 3 [Striga hermonthica]|uniref:Zinc finger protein CONSTANS-LIKE 3 n=1 Tax=Striga hermonthica TaxID=68872 RepID=A0A9N7RM65_STRHE|nr:Zinc finger protein CONSTANS-LIKE 3 [Striga hermonthica]